MGLSSKLPSLLQSSQLLSIFDNFSNAADYHQQLSYFDWRLRDSVDVATFIDEAGGLTPGEPAD